MAPARDLAAFTCRATTGAAAWRVAVTNDGKRQTLRLGKIEAAAAVATDQKRFIRHA